VLKTRESQLAGAVRETADVNVAECYQCGKCTAGCPMAKYMDLSPNQIMRLVQVGDEASAERLLRSSAIWYCAGCLTCTQRCPKELDPAAVIDALREMSHGQGKVVKAAKKILAFHRAFLKTVEKTGRMSEFALTRRYKLATGDLFSDVGLAPAMLFKGKLSLKSHKIPGRGEVKRIFATCRDASRPEHGRGTKGGKR
jgi:heterodisulfide reductase subunit C